MLRKWFIRVVLGFVALFIVIQAVPYGRNHVNPAIRIEPAWSNPEVRALAVRSCYDCHSNETRWPWYSRVAPVSWLIQYDTEAGRSVLNFSEWSRPQPEAAESPEEIEEGEMPPAAYVLLHSEARLSAAERQRLIEGLKSTVGSRNGRKSRSAND